jgi:hypothetical protein
MNAPRVRLVPLPQLGGQAGDQQLSSCIKMYQIRIKIPTEALRDQHSRVGQSFRLNGRKPAGGRVQETNVFHTRQAAGTSSQA